MANLKYFYLSTPAGAEHLVKTTNAATASAAVLSARGTPILAEHDAIRAHFATGGDLHPASLPEGEGKAFLVPTDTGNALIRAKNPGHAAILVHGSELTVRVATQDDLIRCLKNKVEPIELVPTAKACPSPTPSTSPEAEPASADA
jgi:hypothetical protein